MNQEKHWNKIGAKYNDEIFDVFKSDKRNILARYFRKYANKNHTAIDFGCGTGKSFPYLSPSFKEVLAIDISADLLEIAQMTPYKNVRFKKLDLVKSISFTVKTDFAFCCNVVMLPEAEKSQAMLRTVRKSLKKNGTALFVLPSLESALYATWQLMEWYKKENVSADKIPSDELNLIRAKKTDLVDGIIYIDRVPTRHYSASQIEVWFTKAGLKVTALEKIEYDWNSEFTSPPKWLKTPYPWDWLIECKLDLIS
jgi:SAM-dependent methyltransferase